MAISISICNLALSDVRASSIQEIGEASVEARECARHYPAVMGRLIEDHTWSFIKRIATLAELSTNERSSEWLHCYAVPSDCVTAIRLLPTSASSTALASYNWPYERPLTPTWWSDFIIENDKLYCQIEQAQLEYTVGALDEPDMPASFKHALRKALAADLAVPLRDSREMKGDLLKEAEIARQTAIASDVNRQPNRDAYDEVAWARR